MTHEQATQSHAAERYLLGEMDERDQLDFEAHYFECAECAEDVRIGVQLQDGVREAETGRPSTVVPFPPPAAQPLVSAPAASRWRTTFAPLAAAAALALVAGYQALVVIPGLRNESGVALPVTLTAASRGDLPAISVPAGVDTVLLTFDLNLVPAPAEVLYDLASEAGASVSRRRVPVPQPGTSMSLSIPAHLLSAGRFTLTVRDPAAPDTNVGVYSFVVR